MTPPEDFEDITLQPKQLEASTSPATIVFYGGAAGSGKTRWLVHECAKYFDTPGYNACIFRRTYEELTGVGGVCEEMEKVYPLLDGELQLSKHRWRFPSGAKVAWGEMQHEAQSLQKKQGLQYAVVGMDELPHFTEKQFWHLISRLRTMSGVATRLLATMNPDPDSWVRRMIDWYIGEDGYPIESRSGVVRYFERRDGRLTWYGSLEEAAEAGATSVTSFTFIAARIWDNPALLNADPAYLDRLKAMPPVEQARFLGGNWNVRQASGDFFQEAWFPRLQPTIIARTLAKQPLDEDILKSIRVWDLAGTPFEGNLAPGVERDPSFFARTEGDPDWTRGLRADLFRDGRVGLRDLISCRDTPGAVEQLMVKTAVNDGPRVKVVVWQDPGQAAIHQIETLRKAVRRAGRKFQEILARQSKEEYAQLASRVAFKKHILVDANAPWANAFFRELEAFPEGAHDDCVDVLSLVIVYLLNFPKAIVGYDNPQPKNRDPRFGGTRDNDVRITQNFGRLRHL